MAEEIKVLIRTILKDKEFQKGIKNLDKGLDKSAKKSKGFFKSIKAGWIAIGVAVFAVGKIFKSFFRVAKDFEQAIAKVASVTGGATKELEKLARQAGKNTVFSAKEAANALYFLASAGLDVKDMTEVLTPALNLAAAGSLEIAEATDIVVNNLKVFGLEMSDAEKVTDIMATTVRSANTDMAQLSDALRTAGPIAATAGIEFEDLNVIIAAMADRGIKGQRAGVQLRQSIARLTKPTAEAVDALSKYGISVDEITKLLPTPIELFKRLNKANLSNADALAILGVRQSGVFSLIKDGIPTITKLQKAMEDYDGTSKEMAETQIKTVAGALKLLQSKWEEFILVLTSDALPALQKFILLIGNAVGALAQYISDVGKFGFQLSDFDKQVLATGEHYEFQTEAVKKQTEAMYKASIRIEEQKKALAELSEETGGFINRLFTETEAEKKLKKLQEEHLALTEKFTEGLNELGFETIDTAEKFKKAYEVIRDEMSMTDELSETDAIAEEERKSAAFEADTERRAMDKEEADKKAEEDKARSLDYYTYIDEQRVINSQKEQDAFDAALIGLQALYENNKITEVQFNAEIEKLTVKHNEVMEGYAKEIDESNTLRDKMALESFGTRYEDMTAKQKVELDNQLALNNQIAADVSGVWETAVGNVIGSWADGMAEMIIEGEVFKQNFGDVMKSLLKEAGKLLIKLLLVKGVKAALTGGLGLFFSEGGKVPSYYADGGRVAYAEGGMRARGTDTVPAMLTPGERVLDVASTEAFDNLMSTMNIPTAGDISTVNNNQQAFEDNRQFAFNNEQIQGGGMEEFLELAEEVNSDFLRR